MTNINLKPEIPEAIVIDDPNAPMVYADGIIAAGPYHATDGLLRLTFGALMWEPGVNPSRAYTKTVLRVTIPIKALRDGIAFVNGILEGEPDAANMPPVSVRLQ